MRPTELTTETREAIRRLFMARRAYAVSEVARLTGVGLATLSAQIAAGDIEATRRGPDLYLAWSEVAYLGLRRWPLEVIFEAVGDDAASLLPTLLRPTQFSTLLPAYQVRMLEVLARREQLDAGTFLQLHLLDLASASDQRLLDAEIPGFIEALHFPIGDGA